MKSDIARPKPISFLTLSDYLGRIIDVRVHKVARYA